MKTPQQTLNLALILLFLTDCAWARSEENRTSFLEGYLAKEYPAKILQVRLEKSEIAIRGETVADKGSVFLIETPMDVLEEVAKESLEEVIPVPADAAGEFVIRVPRHRSRGGKDYDRVFSRWTLIRKEGDEATPLSAAHWVDEVEAPEQSPPVEAIRHKKGLGGWRDGVLPEELHDLGISAVTINIVLDRLLSLREEADSEPMTWQGRQYFVRMGPVRALDAQLRKAREQKVVVSGILLVGNPAKKPNDINRILGHPDATEEGGGALPNVTNEEGIALYGAVLKLLTERYCRADGRYGRIHHWIMHNEVDAARQWTNAGDKSAIAYVELYQRSMRMMDLMARQMDPASRVFISLTHEWTSPGPDGWYGSRRMVDLLARYGQVEGDFPWGVAFHPYPQSLREPRTWKDDQATPSFDTRKITPKNIEILDTYMKQDALLYRGEVRHVHLSENGFNSRDYSAAELEAQAAGMAYAWKKIRSLSAIQVWHYHNWIDNRGEGGLRIGLRRFPDDAEYPLGKKPIWDVYQAAGTDREDAVFQPYLKTIGIERWEE